MFHWRQRLSSTTISTLFLAGPTHFFHFLQISDSIIVKDYSFVQGVSM